MRRPREKGEQVFRRLFSAASRFDGLEEGEQKTKREGYWNVVADVEGQSFVAGPGGANAFSQSKEPFCTQTRPTSPVSFLLHGRSEETETQPSYA